MASLPSMGIVAVAAVLGFLFQGRDATLIVASLLMGFGCLLNWAFRTGPGPLALFWQRCRRLGDPWLYRFYAVAGPWAWRLGLGSFLGLAVQVAVNRG